VPDASSSALDLIAAPRLLVVDDEAVQRLVVTGIAERCGLVAEQASTIERATELIFQVGFDVVVLDLALEYRDGIELLRCIRDSGCDPVLIFISGFDERVRQSAVRLAHALGIRVIGALAKPLQLDTLRELLTNLPPRPDETMARTAVEISAQELAEGIEAKEIVCLYQPKVALDDRRIVGVEALCRWYSPRHGVVRPDRFIRVAEQHGLIDALSAIILNDSLAAFRTWRTICPELTLAVNVSPLSLVDLTLPERVFAALEAASVPPSSLTLELTESAVMADFVAAADILTRFRIHNVRLSIDDFGTGYSSLLSLLRLPFSELKIDRSFTRLITRDPEAAKIVRAVIRLGRDLDMQVVAEGIDAEGTARLVESFGCAIGQGYLFAPPLDEAELITRLLHARPAAR
jgi:EAL domain-containing protein (putative c-di-GMP-specific phosphodiesterase class I)/ActR/RegA family two-component response regulator